MREEGLYPLYKGVSSFSSLCELSEVHNHTVNYCPFLKQDDYIDYRLVEFLRNRSGFASLDWDSILSGAATLPYTHTAINSDAWEKGIPKFFLDLPSETSLDVVQMKALDLAWEWTEKHFMPFLMNSKVRTHDEVMETMVFDASPGFPMNLWYPTKKLAYSDPSFLSYLEWKWDASAALGSEKTYYLCSLKDEFRPIEKVLQNKTRVFTAASAEHVYVTARMMGDMLDKLTKACIQTASSIGVRQDHLDFDLLWQKLRENLNIVALDATNWDGRIMAYLLIKFMFFAWKTLRASDRTEENWNRLVNVFSNAIYAYMVLPDGAVFLSQNCMKSGDLFTAGGNTIMHFSVFAYCWIMNTQNHNYDDFMEHVGKSMELYGDDNTYSHSNECAFAMAAPPVIKRALDLGVIYEDSNASWDDVSFLSHRFCQVPYRGRYVTVPVRPFMAILSGWLQDGNGSWQRAVERTAGYRNQAYFHPILYRAMTDWMVDVIQTNDPNNRQGLRSLILPDSEVEKLHFSDEGCLIETGCKTTKKRASPVLI